MGDYRIAEEYSHLHIPAEDWMGMEKKQRSSHLEHVFCTKEVADMWPQQAKAALTVGYLESGLTGVMAYDLQRVWCKAELILSVSGSVVCFPNHKDHVVVLERGSSYTVISDQPKSPDIYAYKKKCANYRKFLHCCEHL